MVECEGSPGGGIPCARGWHSVRRHRCAIRRSLRATRRAFAFYLVFVGLDVYVGLDGDGFARPVGIDVDCQAGRGLSGLTNAKMIIIVRVPYACLTRALHVHHGHFANVLHARLERPVKLCVGAVLKDAHAHIVFGPHCLHERMDVGGRVAHKVT